MLFYTIMFFRGFVRPLLVLITRRLMTGDVVFLLLSGLKGLNGFTHEEQTALQDYQKTAGDYEVMGDLQKTT